jgi:hypothetical protein
MKAKIYIPKQIYIPDEELPRLARMASRRRSKDYPARKYPIRVGELIEEAARAGIVRLPEDYATDGDDERRFYDGRIHSWEEYCERLEKRGRQGR